jgi:hypothetical protein
VIPRAGFRGSDRLRNCNCPQLAGSPLARCSSYLNATCSGESRPRWRTSSSVPQSSLSSAIGSSQSPGNATHSDPLSVLRRVRGVTCAARSCEKLWRASQSPSGRGCSNGRPKEIAGRVRKNTSARCGGSSRGVNLPPGTGFRAATGTASKWAPRRSKIALTSGLGSKSDWTHSVGMTDKKRPAVATERNRAEVPG